MSTLSTVSRALSKMVGVVGGAIGVAVEHQNSTQNDSVQHTNRNGGVSLELEENDGSIVIVNPANKSQEGNVDEDKPPAFEEHEIDSAMNSMASSRRGQLLDSFLPVEFNELSSDEQDRALSHILQGVRNVLSDPILSADIAIRAKKAVHGGGDFLTSFSSSFSPDPSYGKSPTTAMKKTLHQLPSHYDHNPYLNISQGMMWENLTADHPCLICCDLLAAPVIAQCGHSFCGVCITQYVSYVEKNEDVDVELQCPSCRECMKTKRLTYERHLDGIIENLVDRIPPCEQKKEWKQRQLTYKKELARKKKAHAANDASSDGETDGFLKWLVDLTVPIVAVAVVIFMILSRLRR